MAQVVLVGDSGAGKSSLLAAFAGDIFERAYTPTVGVEFKARTVRIDDGDGHSGTVKLTLWDSAGATISASSRLISQYQPPRSGDWVVCKPLRVSLTGFA